MVHSNYSMVDGVYLVDCHLKDKEFIFKKLV